LSKVAIVSRVHSKRGNYIPNRTSDEARPPHLVGIRVA